MYILVLGDSDSQKEEKYVFKLGRSANETFYTFHLTFSFGSGLEAYNRALLSNNADCTISTNGDQTAFKTNLCDFLVRFPFDYIFLKVDEKDSVDEEKYQPYLSKIEKKLHDYQPRAKIYLLGALAFFDNSPNLLSLGFNSQKEMQEKIEVNLKKAEKTEGISGYVSLTYAQNLAKKYEIEAQKENGDITDSGAFLYSLMIYQTLSDKDVCENTMRYLDKKIDEETLEKIKRTAKEAKKLGGKDEDTVNR